MFKLAPSGKYTVVHDFPGGNKDGLFPFAVPVRDRAGNLYGTTPEGGRGGHGGCHDGPPGCGTVFKVDSNGREVVLHAFGGNSDGVGSFGPVVLDPAGNLYGTTFIGGNHGCPPPPPPPGGRGCGTIYKIDTTGKETVLYRWHGNLEFDPHAGLVLDKKGNLCGSTFHGGNPSCATITQGTVGCGTIFKLDPRGKLTVLHSFTGGADGRYPSWSRLLLDAHGNLYGTTTATGDGMSNPGEIFKITP